MDKIVFCFVLLFLFSGSLFSQTERNVQPQQDQQDLQLKVRSLERKITGLQDSIRLNKVYYEAANRINDTSNNIIGWTGWIGILVTALLFTFGFYYYFSFSSSKKEINQLIEEANLRLAAAEDKFNSFINSPEKINDLLEDFNFKQIEKEIDSNYEKVFIQGLSRANVLSEEKRIILAQRIKSKIYDPDYLMHFTHMYSFLKDNLPTGVIKEIAVSYFFHFKDRIDLQALYHVMYDIFSFKPYSVSPYNLYKEVNQDNKDIAFSIFTKLLEEGDLLDLTEEIIARNDLIPNLDSINRESLTNIVTKRIDEISKEVLDKIIMYLDFNEIIFSRRLSESKSYFWQDKYIVNSLNSKKRFAFLLSNIDLKLQANWIGLFDLNLPKLSDQDKFEVLNSKYINTLLPDDDFFSDDLPLFFEPNYGIVRVDGEYRYRNRMLPVLQTRMQANGMLCDVVTHPLLSKHIEITRANGRAAEKSKNG